jgi:hypothetical protein
LKDLQGFVSRTDILEVDFSQDPFNNGWQQITASGSDSWQYLANSMYHGFVIRGHSGSCNYLISPDIYVAPNMVLTLSHRIPDDAGNNAGMKLYYTASFNGTINEADLHELTIPSYPSTEGIVTISLPNNISSNYRLIFKYADSQTSTWYINGITVSGEAPAMISK